LTSTWIAAATAAFATAIRNHLQYEHVIVCKAAAAAAAAAGAALYVQSPM
jgi:hypothetical protein